jgi:C4-dicarboxylate-specific signal transduction histidine kinase
VRSGGWRERLDAATDVLGGALARAHSARELAEARDHVAHMGRVVTMGQLSSALSHELRQPLTAVRLHAETGLLILAQEPPDVDQARELFRDVVDDNTRAIDVLEHVRLLVRKETASSAEVSVNEISRDTAKLLHRDAESRSVDIELSLAEPLPPVLGDAVQLQQVMINLVLNAVESAATSPHTRRVVISTAEREGQVEIAVSDSGPGIPPEILPLLFQSYVSTKKAGLGMGLAIVRQIVEQHHGEVHGQSVPSGGALFRVTLPPAPGLAGGSVADPAHDDVESARV